MGFINQLIPEGPHLAVYKRLDNTPQIFCKLSGCPEILRVVSAMAQSPRTT